LIYSQYQYGLEVEQQDAKIEGKLNLNELGENVFIGTNAGMSNGYSNVIGSSTEGFANVYIGFDSGKNESSSQRNTYLGYKTGIYGSSSVGNTFIGSNTGVGGNSNTFIGSSAGAGALQITNGSDNVFVGLCSGCSNTSGNYNTFLGKSSGSNNTTGHSNTFIGHRSGQNNLSGSGNVFIGERAGFSEIGSFQLYIENSSSTTPLIYGEFDNDKAGINWDSSISLPATLSVNGTANVSDTLTLQTIMQLTPLDASTITMNACTSGEIFYGDDDEFYVCKAGAWKQITTN